jgi:protein tyrosine/serine phosphatase
MEPAPAATPRRRKARLGAIVLLIAGIVLAAALAREYFVARRFGAVEPGLYRGGYAQPPALKRILAAHGIRHILCLANYNADEPKGRKEQKVAAEMGVEFKLLPMPGDGTADFPILDAAADFIADPANRPLFVHCAAGVQRTGAAIVAYRIKHLGWDYDRAIAEAEGYGLDRDNNPELYDHLRRYVEYVAGRTATTSAKAP